MLQGEKDERENTIEIYLPRSYFQQTPPYSYITFGFKKVYFNDVSIMSKSLQQSRLAALQQSNLSQCDNF